MDALIPIISQLQAILSNVGLIHERIDLPQIAVVGAQSVGKSSVIEALVGKDFLPRGTGIVTRRPLLLQLQTTQDKSECAEFGHLPGKIFTEFSQIRNEIIRITDISLGNDKNISSEIIVLKILSPNVINLTLIDLPGITKVPVGDQPSDIEHQVRKIIMQYIQKPNCIILAITAANTDIANSDSLKMAREVDPQGNRTIGVISKCDTLEDGFDALDSLLGKIYPLKLGYIGVVCRSQKQTNDNKSIEQALKDEENFFASHPSYSAIKSGCGIKCLATILNQVLLYHIIDSIPDVKYRLTNFLYSTEQELANYEEPIASDDNPGALLLNFFSRFSRHFEDALDGKLPCQSTGQLTGGARINFIFHDWYTKILKDFNPLSGLTDLEIRTTIRNTAGPKASLFVPDAAFEILVKRQIRHLESPSLKCVEQVYLELKDIVETCDLPEMKRYTNLRDHILKVVHDILARLLDPANKMIRNLIQMQTAYINTNHPDFMHNVVKLLHLPDNEPTLSPHTSSSSNLNISPLQENNIPNLLVNQFRSKMTNEPTNKCKQLKPIENNSNGTTHKILPLNNSLTEMNANNANSGIFSYFLKGKSNKEEFFDQKPHTHSQFDSQTNSPNKENRHISQSELGVLYNSLKIEEIMSYDTPNIRLPSIPSRIVPNEPPSEREALESRLIKSLIHTYFCIVRQSVADSVPKAIMLFMVNSAKEIIPRQLVATLYKDDLFSELLEESETIIKKRAELKNLQSKLRKALEILNAIPEYYLEGKYHKH